MSLLGALRTPSAFTHSVASVIGPSTTLAANLSEARKASMRARLDEAVRVRTNGSGFAMAVYRLSSWA